MPLEHLCEETYDFDERTQEYLRCGAPAFVLVKHRGRREGPYWMCPHHAAHNIDNRNGEDITPKPAPLPTHCLAGATLLIHAKPGLWTPGIFAQWETHAAPRFKDGESCSSANYFEPRAARDEYDTARSYFGFVYTVQPGNRVCYVHWNDDGKEQTS